MGLLQEIIDEASASTADVPRLLRLCLRLASKIGNDPLAAWARQELNGYPVGAALPDYRLLAARSSGNFVGPYRSWQATLEIPLSVLPEDIRDKYQSARIRESAAEVADLVAKASGKGNLMMPWPVAVARQYAVKTLAQGTTCLSAWMEVSRSEMVGLLDQLKTRVLDFALEIEKEFPEADASPPARPVNMETRVTQIFNTTIHGAVQNVAAGSTNVTQNALTQVHPGDFEALRRRLREAGVADTDVDELRAAISADEATGSPSGMGARARDWLGKMTIKAGQGVAGVGSNVVAGVVTQALLMYFGMAG